MLVDHNACIDTQDVEGFDKINLGTPLHRAAGNGHLSVVEYLINQMQKLMPKIIILLFQAQVHTSS